MERIRLGDTGLVVSRLALGTATFGSQCDERTSHEILDRASDAGINFLDTADTYPLGADDEIGRTERIVGSWLKGRRARFVLATKVHPRSGPERRLSRQHILAAVDASLRRLETDHIELYQVHTPDPGTPIEETLEALDALVRSGKVRYVGLSNYPAEGLTAALVCSRAHGFARPISVQQRYNLLFRDAEHEIFPLCRREGVAVLAYGPLAGGLLTGKHDRSRPPVSGRFRIARYRERYWRDRDLDMVDALRAEAARAETSMTTMAVAWVLSNPDVTCSIVGVSEAAQLGPVLQALAARSDDATRTPLKHLSDRRRGS